MYQDLLVIHLNQILKKKKVKNLVKKKERKLFYLLITVKKKIQYLIIYLAPGPGAY